MFDLEMWTSYLNCFIELVTSAKLPQSVMGMELMVLDAVEGRGYREPSLL